MGTVWAFKSFDIDIERAHKRLGVLDHRQIIDASEYIMNVWQKACPRHKLWIPRKMAKSMRYPGAIRIFNPFLFFYARQLLDSYLVLTVAFASSSHRRFPPFLILSGPIRSTVIFRDIQNYNCLVFRKKVCWRRFSILSWYCSDIDNMRWIFQFIYHASMLHILYMSINWCSMRSALILMLLCL